MMTRTRSTLLVAASIGLILAISCKSSGGDGKELADALASIGANDLAIMVLPQGELGAAYAELTTEDTSGFQTAADVADDSVSPDDEEAEVTDAGWESGYKLSFADESLAPLEDGEGVIGVDTQAHLFSDEEAAAAYIENELLNYERFNGEEVDDGLTLEEFEEFDVEGLPDGARGVRARAAFSDTEFHLTIIWFPLEQIVGVAEVAYADDADVTGEVEEIAGKLRARIESVALGETEATPEDIPVDEGSGDDPTVEPPEDVPDLSAMALTLADMPAGTEIDHEGYVQNDNTVATFEREFDISSADGGAAFGSITCNLGLAESTAEATGVFIGIRSLLQGPSLVQFLTSAFSEGAGFDVTSVEIGDVTQPAAGDEAVLVDFTFDTPVGDFAGAYLYFRVDRVISYFALVGQPGAVNPQDLVPLAQTMFPRIQQGLNSFEGG